MKNIFFYGNIMPSDMTSGITKKVLSQISSLREMGYQVYYTGYTSDGVAIFDNEDQKVFHEKYWFNSDKLNRYLRRWKLLVTAKKFVSSTDLSFELSYLRFHFFDGSYLRLLKKLKENGSKIIVEAHSYPYRSKKINPFLLTHIIDIIYEPFIRKYIDLVAAISNKKEIWGCKTVHIDNAIDINEVKLQNKKEAHKNEIRLICVSNERYYHGYKKLIRGLYEYYKTNGERNITINFVGEYKESTKILVQELGLDEHIFFSGKKYGSELEEAYNNADLGVGAFTARAGEQFGSSIKTKEYFAKGLPFINGWKEYSFDDSYPYVKRFPLNVDNIDFNKVEEFYDTIKSDKNMQLNMRNFAKENFTWLKQFEKVISFFEN